MGLEEVERIRKFFFSHNLNPTYLEHEAVITSEDAARTRGFELRQGIKALLFSNGEEFVIVDVPADRMVNHKKVARQMGWSNSKTKMATPAIVLEKTGCEIGAVPPFGHKEEIQILVDKGVYDNKESGFNIGLRTQSVRIKTEEMKRVFEEVGAVEGDFVK